jgi:hypothetical protein
LANEGLTVLKNEVAYLLAIVTMPYTVAIIIGLCNGTFYKYRNIGNVVDRGMITHFKSKTSMFSLIVSFPTYVVTSICVWLAIIAMLDKAMAFDLNVIFLAIVACFGLFVMLHLFCELRIVGNDLYVFSVQTFFRVKVFNVSDIDKYETGGTPLFNCIRYSVHGKSYVFFALSNDNEFVRAIEAVKGV